MRVARQVRVKGRAQGVFFRVWAKEQAENLGITGWVRNASDGSVEAHIEGEKGAVQQMLDLLHRGPPLAEVECVEIEDAAFEGGISFEVRH